MVLNSIVISLLPLPFEPPQRPLAKYGDKHAVRQQKNWFCSCCGLKIAVRALANGLFKAFWDFVRVNGQNMPPSGRSLGHGAPACHLQETQSVGVSVCLSAPHSKCNTTAPDQKITTTHTRSHRKKRTSSQK